MANMSGERKDAPIEITDVGFRFGTALVERVTTLPKNRVVISVATLKASFYVHATEDGELFVHVNGTEIAVK